LTDRISKKAFGLTEVTLIRSSQFKRQDDNLIKDISPSFKLSSGLYRRGAIDNGFCRTLIKKDLLAIGRFSQKMNGTGSSCPHNGKRKKPAFLLKKLVRHDLLNFHVTQKLFWD
jgi:hypothetical protein